MLTHSELKEILEYDPETGLFTWLKPTSRRVKKGSIAGSGDHGYIHIVINKKRYLAHRLAWFYMTEKWPDCGIKHLNGLPEDNRFCNLKEGTRKR